jgi:tripartite-type tricarboxylate transporter receptor subunit TctC
MSNNLTIQRGRRAVIAAAGATVAATVLPAVAQEGGKPIRIIVGFAPGGSNDIVGRAIAQQLTERLKRSVVVENRPGAGATIAGGLAARAEPDGTTLLLASSTFTMNPAVMKLSYDPVKDFVPVAMLGMGPSVITVNAGMPVRNVREFIDYSKKNPGKVNAGTAGAASFQHFGLELLKLKTGADITLLHYKGGGQVLADLAAGHIQLSLGSLIQTQSLVKAGKIKLLAVAGSQRVGIIPDVPTLRESGIDIDVSNWWALLAPAGTPDAAVKAIHDACNASLNDPAMKDRFAKEGAIAMPMTRQAFAQLMSEETKRWADVARETNIKSK